MVCFTWREWLPEQSVASQVLVSVNVPGQARGVVTSLSKWTVAGPQVSVAVGGVKLGVAGQSMVASAPAAVIVGGGMSLTAMVWDLLTLLPQASDALHVRLSASVPAQVPPLPL